VLCSQLDREGLGVKYVDVHISNRAVRLDGEEFDNCVFQNCTLEIGGAAEFTLDGCTLINCQWVFVDAAAVTLGAMARIYTGMVKDGEALVEQTFEYIRRGSGFGRPFRPPEQ
jgi:hypothetical protein